MSRFYGKSQRRKSNINHARKTKVSNLNNENSIIDDDKFTNLKTLITPPSSLVARLATDDLNLEGGKERYWRNEIYSQENKTNGKPYFILSNNLDTTRTNPGTIYGQIFVSLDIMMEEEPIGDFNIIIKREEDNVLEGRITSIELRHHPNTNPERNFKNINKGYGTYCVENILNMMRNGGIERVSIHAVGGGAYFWARQGFDLDPRVEALEDELMISTSLMREKMIKRYAEKILYMRERSTPEKMTLFSNAVQSRKPRTLQELVALLPTDPVTNPRTGKTQKEAAILMEGIEYHGIKFL